MSQYETCIYISRRQFTIPQILGAINEALHQVLLHRPMEEIRLRRGGYFCLTEQGVPLITVMIGSVESAREREEYRTFAEEKPMRTHRMRRLHGSISSWPSRNLNTYPPRYGGGLWIEDSEQDAGFSGLNEHGDEMVLLVGFLMLHCISPDFARRVVAISQNPLANIEALAEYFKN